MTLTVAIVSAGAMGSAIARRLVSNGVVVLTSLEGRGPASCARAASAGMKNATDAQIIDEASILLSIAPPSEAVALARRFAAAPARSGRRPIFVDCNAASVSCVEEAGRLIASSGGSFVDGAIIGFPPKGDEAGPTFYFSGPDAPKLDVLAQAGLCVRIMDGAVGAASTLKLSYAGITKGLVAIGAAMILAAERAGAGEALKAELAASQPQLLERFAKTLPDMYPKAYRWVAEMRAISDLIGQVRPEAMIFEGAAGLYERIARDVAGAGTERDQIDAFFGK